MQPGRADADAECPASRRIAGALTGSRTTLQPASPPGGTWGCLSAVRLSPLLRGSVLF